MRKLLLSTLFVFSAIVTFAADVVTKEGAWCWFADPRAIHFADAEAGIDASYIGYIDVHGNVKATQIDWKNNKRTEVLVRSYFQPDDHNNPTFIVLPDKRVMIFYTRHTDEAKIWYRISQKPGDITMLGEEKYLTTKNNTTYPSPFILSDDPDHIYLCWRGINWHPTIARLTMPDENDNCSFDFGPKQIVQSTGARPYAKYYSNGKDKIYLTYTTGHPDNEMPNWLYFNVIDINNGNGPILKDIKGTTLKKVADGPFNVNKTDSYAKSYPYTVVDKTANCRNWVWQIATDKDENPVIALTHIDNAKTTHVYHYARWTGSAWRDTWVQYGGHAFHQNWNSTEKCYSGGMALDPDSINNLYLSIPTKDGVYNKDGVYEIWKYVIGDDGKVVSQAQVTKNSEKNNMRPYILNGSVGSKARLAWMNGDYYYWMVKTAYPKGYPTCVMIDTELPHEAVDLNAGANANAGDKTFTITKFASMDTTNYNGVFFTAGNIEVGLSADTKLYISAAGKTYTSSSMFYTSDDWATKSSGTSGDFHPTKLTSATITLAYDGEYLYLYRNEMLEIKVAVADLTYTNVANGTIAGEVKTWSRSLNQEEVAEMKGMLAASMLSVPTTVTTDIVLPSSASGVEVKWTSSNPEVISNDGIVKFPTAETEVTLTAAVGTIVKEFKTIVMPRNINNNLLVKYDFEEGDVYTEDNVKYVRDLSGNGNDMKVMGSAKVDGTLNLKSNQPVAFSTNGYGLAPAGLLKGMRSYTFMVDANLSNRGKMPRFYDFGSNSGNSIFCRINGNFYYGAGEKYAGGSTLMVEATANAIALNTTTTIVVTFDAATHTTTIYADGKKVAQGTKITYEPWQAAPAGEDSRNYIGRTQWWDNNSDNGDVCGTIDNFRLYNIALTAEELSEIASDINNMVTTITPADTKIYSLTGVRLNSEPNKGLYIKDGKKIIK